VAWVNKRERKTHGNVSKKTNFMIEDDRLTVTSLLQQSLTLNVK
jgi:hypothetical protein